VLIRGLGICYYHKWLIILQTSNHLNPYFLENPVKLSTHWQSPNIGATNESGFTALPSGGREANGTFGGVGDDGLWWSSSETSATIAYNRYMDYLGFVSSSLGSKQDGFSVRCLRDL
jgi:uncharacterized protein (TIGR02145 family)